MANDVAESTGIRARVAKLMESRWVQIAITTVIVINAITLGLETSATVQRELGNTLNIVDSVILGIFVIELALKMFGQGWRFFTRAWNLFDFVIVGISLVPSSGALSVLRALRVLRIFRLVSVVPAMRRVVGALLSAIPGVSSVVLLMLLVFYVFSVMATKLFGAAFPKWFGTVGESMYSLFQIMTLESWSMGIVRPVMEQFPNAWVLFVGFILITSFAVLNLFHRCDRERDAGTARRRSGGGTPGHRGDRPQGTRDDQCRDRCVACRNSSPSANWRKRQKVEITWRAPPTSPTNNRPAS